MTIDEQRRQFKAVGLWDDTLEWGYRVIKILEEKDDG